MRCGVLCRALSTSCVSSTENIFDRAIGCAEALLTPGVLVSLFGLALLLFNGFALPTECLLAAVGVMTRFASLRKLSAGDSCRFLSFVLVTLLVMFCGIMFDCSLAFIVLRLSLWSADLGTGIGCVGTGRDCPFLLAFIGGFKLAVDGF